MIEVDNVFLKSAMKNIFTAVGKQPERFLAHVKVDHMILYAEKDSIAIRHKLACKAKEPTKFSVVPEDLATLANRKELTFTVDETKHLLTFKSSSITGSLNMHVVLDRPNFVKPEEAMTVAKPLVEGFSKARPYLDMKALSSNTKEMPVFVHCDGETAYIALTDSLRLVFISFPCKHQKLDFTIFMSAFKIVQSLFSSSITMRITDTVMLFSNAEILLQVPQIEEDVTFAKIQTFISQDYDVVKKVKIDANLLRQAVYSVCAFIADTDKSLKFTFSTDILEITIRSTKGTMTERIKTEGSVKNTKSMLVDGRMIEDVVSKFVKGDVIVRANASTLALTMVQDETKTSYFMALMADTKNV